MEIQDLIKLAGRKKRTIFSIVIICFVISLSPLIIYRPEYKATSRVLVIQTNNLMDAYSISRSNQFLTNTLSQVIYSESFLDDVLNSGFSIDKNIFSSDQNKRMEQWDRMVSAKPIGDTGVIVIDNYYKDKIQAEQISKAITYTLKVTHQNYHGLGKRVSVTIIDKTVVSNWPVRPNFILNGLVGIIFGFTLGFIFIYLFPEKEFSFLPKRKAPKQRFKMRLVEIREDNQVKQNYSQYNTQPSNPMPRQENNREREIIVEGDIRNIFN